jgi:sialidase-1
MSASAMAQTPPAHVDVFTSGKDGYAAYRIPAIEVAPDGSVLAFAEARKNNLGDPGMDNNEIDLVCKRSVDGGRTWSAMKIVEHSGKNWSSANPATAVDRDTKRVWVLYIRCKPNCNTDTARPGTDDVQNLARYSEDNGQTWSEPIDMTNDVRDMKHPQWRTTVVGPGGMIQDSRGRLVAAAWRFAPWAVFAIYSEDHGRTWHRGEMISHEGMPKNHSPNETELVEMANGRILIDYRDEKIAQRWMAESADGGRTWSKARAGNKVTPVACAIERYTLKSAGDDRDRIVWTGPKGPDRKNLILRVSYDEGKTFPIERLIAAEPAAYSDLAILKDKTVGVLWERNDYKQITFTRLTREFIDPIK